MRTKENFPEDAVVIKGESKIFTEPSEPEKGKNNLKDLRGKLKQHKEDYTSIELQHKSSTWRSNVSD